MRGDVSRDAADICLLGNDLSRLPWAIDLAKQTECAVRLNLFWVFAYNAIGIVLATSGYLNPIFAAVAMIGSSLFVVTNSLRLAGNDNYDNPRRRSHDLAEMPDRRSQLLSISQDTNGDVRSNLSAGSGEPCTADDLRTVSTATCKPHTEQIA